MSRILSSYLRTCRRQWALTQRDLARLLGTKSAQHVSRIEHGKRNPSAFLLLGCEIIFGKHARDIFPKFYDEIEEEVIRNLYLFQQELEHTASPSEERKRQLAAEALHRAIIRSKQQKDDEA